MYLYRILAGTFSQVRFGQDVGISNDRFRQFLLYNIPDNYSYRPNEYIINNDRL